MELIAIIPAVFVVVIILSLAFWILVAKLIGGKDVKSKATKRGVRKGKGGKKKDKYLIEIDPPVHTKDTEKDNP